MSKSKIKNKIKSKIKELGAKAVLGCLISVYNAKANKHSGGKARIYKKKVKRYRSRLEDITREVAKNFRIIKGYHASMEEFYQKYESGNDTSTSEIGKILAGDYRENEKRVWYWKNRVKKIEEYLENKQGLPELAQREIFSILNKNRYFMKKKKTELTFLKNILFKDEGVKREITDYLQGTTSYQEPEKHTPKIIEKDDQFRERRLADNQEKEGEQTTQAQKRIEKEDRDEERRTPEKILIYKERREKKESSDSLESTLEREEVRCNGKLVTLPSKGNLIVIGKINGIRGIFNKAIKKFEEEYNQNQKTYLLILGNYLQYTPPWLVERISEESMEILDKLIELKKKYGDHIISLTGAEEIACYKRVAKPIYVWEEHSEREHDPELIKNRKNQLKEHAKYLEKQPIAAQIPNKFLFSASGPLKWVKTLEDVANVKDSYDEKMYDIMMQSLSDGRDNFQNEEDYINAGKERLKNWGLKGAIYGDGVIHDNKLQIRGHQMKFLPDELYLKLDLSKDYKNVYDLKLGKEILRFNKK